MTKHQREPRHQRNLESEKSEVHGPYWQRAHRDWRFLAVVVLMLVAMGAYVMAGNFVWKPRGAVVPLLGKGGK